MEKGNSSGTLVSAGTGSGKTLAFYLPALSRIFEHVVTDENSKRWVKVLAIYPRNELLRDQFREIYGEVRILDRILENERKIKLGISCESVDGKGYFLFPRSSISKTPLRMANSIGLIDGGYRGEIMASCDNIKDHVYRVNKGQRLFQLVAFDSSPITYSIKEELTETSRGKDGFGSTGK